MNVKHSADIAATVWEITVKRITEKTLPTPAGQLGGAPVLGCLFPISLKPTNVEFDNIQGIAAFTLASHLDFDGTPLGDENTGVILQ